jgi:single-strand DNA-binding protein
LVLLGNLTRDPELKQTEGKKSVCVFGLATNRNWTTETGEKREETEFHRIVAWDKWAGVCQQYLRKGRKVYIEGRLQSRTYTGQDGIEKFSTEIVLEELVFVDSMPKEVQDTLEVKGCVRECSDAAGLIIRQLRCGSQHPAGRRSAPPETAAWQRERSG